MRTGSRSPTRPPFIEAPLPRSGATAAPVAVSNETVLHRGVEPYCNDFTHKRRGLQRDRPSSRHDVTMGRSEMGHGSRSPTRPPFIEACTRSTTRAGWTVAVSNETALHRGTSKSEASGYQWKSRSPTRPPFIEAEAHPRYRPSSYRSRSPTRPPFIEACSCRAPSRCRATSRGLQRDRPSSRQHRPRRARPGDRSRSPTRPPFIEAPSSAASGRRAVVAVSNETALHRGLAEVIDTRGADASRSPTRPPFIEACQYLLPACQADRSRSPTRPPFIEACPVGSAFSCPPGRGLQRDRPSSRPSSGTWATTYWGSRGLQRDRPSSRLGRHVAVGVPGPGRGLQRDRPSSRLAARPGPPALGEVAVSDETALHRGLYRPGRRHRGRLVAVSDETALHRGSLYGYCGPGARSVAVSDETALHRGRFLPSGW